MRGINLLDAISEISHEKEIDREVLISALETALLQAAQRKYTNFDNIEVVLDRKIGSFVLQQYKVVVQTIEDSDNEIDLDEAKNIDDGAELGDEIAFTIDNKEVRNTIAQATRQILLNKVRGIEYDTVMKKFSDKIMQIVHGKVAKIEANRTYIILSSNIEAAIDRRDMLWNDRFQSGEMIRALLLDIKAENKQHMLVLSRTHQEFLVKLLQVEIPEIYDGSIEIVQVAREPGRKSKVVVRSKDPDIDPVGACIGPRGSRISPVISELNGERIDIIAWSDNVGEKISGALNVEGIRSITVDEVKRIAHVEIKEESLPSAIGKQGQNVRLAQKIANYEIKFVPFSPEIKRKELLADLFKPDPSTVNASKDAPADKPDKDVKAKAGLDKEILSGKESAKTETKTKKIAPKKDGTATKASVAKSTKTKTKKIAPKKDSTATKASVAKSAKTKTKTKTKKIASSSSDK